MELDFRGAMRPGYVALGGARAPIGVYRNLWNQRGRWRWLCRLDCWAQRTSSWHVDSWGRAIGDGLEHLHLYHRPEPCTAPRLCTESHVLWVTSEAGDSLSWPCHLRNWRPVAPLLNAHVTQSDLGRVPGAA